jgi:predicted dehydrogenase
MKSRETKSTASKSRSQKIRFAVVGQGYFAQSAILPAFKHSKRAELVALVSGEKRKLTALGRKHQVQNLCLYDEYEYLLQSGDIDAVYVALPNWMHREYTEKALQSGIHVLCEKPLAVSLEDAESMVRLAAERQTKLMTAYRLHFEEANLTTIDLIQKGRIGDPRIFNSVFSFPVEAGNIRAMSPVIGGGPIYDIGVYCINAARYIFQDDPIEVFAYSGSRENTELPEIDETVSVQMKFPQGRLASFTVSFGASRSDFFEVVGTQGSLCLDPAYEYASQKTLWITRNEKTQVKKFKKRDQIAPELDYFADAILKDRLIEPSGLEGMIDVLIIQAIHESLLSGSPIELDIRVDKARPGLKQEVSRPPVQQEPKLVRAKEPSKKVA